MTFDRDGKPGERDSRPEVGDRIDEALKAFAADDDETSSDDADASVFLERFPPAARERERPDDG